MGQRLSEQVVVVVNIHLLQANDVGVAPSDFVENHVFPLVPRKSVQRCVTELGLCPGLFAEDVKGEDRKCLPLRIRRVIQSKPISFVRRIGACQDN